MCVDDYLAAAGKDQNGRSRIAGDQRLQAREEWKVLRMKYKHSITFDNPKRRQHQ